MAELINHMPAQAFIPVDLRSALMQIRDRLVSTDIEGLVQNADPIRGRFNEVMHLLLDPIVDAIQHAAFIEFLRFNYLWAERNINSGRWQRRPPKGLKMT